MVLILYLCLVQEWIPLTPNRSVEQDTQPGTPERQYLIVISHMQVRGYTDSEDKFRLRYTSDKVLPMKSSLRRRAATRKTRQPNKPKDESSSLPSSSSINGGQDAVPWMNLVTTDPGEQEGTEEIRETVQPADLVASLARFLENRERGQQGPFIMTTSSDQYGFDFSPDSIEAGKEPRRRSS